MRACVLLATVATVATVATAAAAAAAAGGRVAGGQDASIEQYPALVQVERQDPFSGVWAQACGGTVLTSLWVLSAAHCFSGITYAPSLRRVRAGSTWRGQGGVLHDVLQEYNHPDYDVIPRDADVSVVRLASALVWTPAVAAGAIASSSSRLPAGAALQLAGWGAQQPGGAPSAQLQHATLSALAADECAAHYEALGALVTPGMLCALGGGEGGEGGQVADACEGDEGGALYYEGVAVGVVSGGEGCAEGRPRLAASVIHHSDWILQTVGQY